MISTFHDIFNESSIFSSSDIGKNIDCMLKYDLHSSFIVILAVEAAACFFKSKNKTFENTSIKKYFGRFIRGLDQTT